MDIVLKRPMDSSAMAPASIDCALKKSIHLIKYGKK